MTSDTFESVASSARRRLYATYFIQVAVIVVFGLVTAEIYNAVPYTFSLPSAFWILVWGIVFYVPLAKPPGDLRFRTAKPPETVRKEFLGADNPLVGYRRGAVDSIETDGDTTQFTFESPVRTKTLRYTAEELHDGIELDVTYNGSDWSSFRFVVESADDETVVRTASSSVRRLSLRQVLRNRALDSCQRRAYELHGYQLDCGGQ